MQRTEYERLVALGTFDGQKVELLYGRIVRKEPRGNEVYYPVPLHLQPCFRELGYLVGSLPVAETAANEALALPIYGELTESQQSWVVEAIRNFFQQKA